MASRPTQLLGDLVVDVVDGRCDTPCRRTRRPPSRSSTASNSPVEAPEGTAARPTAPDSSSTSTSTVGLPRESRICLPTTSTMMVMGCPPGHRCRGRLRPTWRAVVVVLRGQSYRSPLAALARGQLGRAVDPALEAVAGLAQGQLGIDAGLARHVDGGEQQVAELVPQPVLELRAGRRGPLAGHGQRALEQGRELAVLLGDLGKRLERALPVEADRGGALLQLARQSSAGSVPGTSWKMPSRPSCSRLMRSHSPRTSPAVSATASPKMWAWRRMSLVSISAATLPRSPACCSSSRQREEVDLKEHVAELAVLVVQASPADRLGELVDLFDRVADDVLARCSRSQGHCSRRMAVMWRSETSSWPTRQSSKAGPAGHGLQRPPCGASARARSGPGQRRSAVSRDAHGDRSRRRPARTPPARRRPRPRRPAADRAPSTMRSVRSAGRSRGTNTAPPPSARSDAAGARSAAAPMYSKPDAHALWRRRHGEPRRAYLRRRGRRRGARGSARSARRGCSPPRSLCRPPSWPLVSQRLPRLLLHLARSACS